MWWWCRLYIILLLYYIILYYYYTPLIIVCFSSVYIVMIGNTVIYVLPLLAGLALFSYYTSQNCDPITGGLIESPNQVRHNEIKWMVFKIWHERYIGILNVYLSIGFQLVTHFLMETLNYPGVPGMFVASLCAGSLRWVSGAFWSLSSF